MEKVSSISDHIGFRKCAIMDIPLMSQVGSKAYVEHYAHIWQDGPEFYLNKSFSKTVFRKEVPNATIEYYLIYFEDQPIGLLKLNLFKGLDGQPNPKMIELEKIYIIKAYSSKNVGSTTISFLKHLATYKQISYIWLSVMTTSKAMDFYVKHGFEAVSYWQLDFKNLKKGYREMLKMKLNVAES
ncbi:GNAT family N-acetyltransferase [Flavobacteriaceae bacterium M23B6Z8]